MTEGTNGVVFEPLIGGFATITGGGTRNAVKLSRPWQPPLPIAPEKCPFCTKPQEEITLPGIPKGWKLLPNIFTPHRRHRLIVPDTCWDADKLQTLGGVVKIDEALETARLAIQNDPGDPVEMAVFIHVGSLAGQGLGHPHWHLMEVRIREPLRTLQFPPELLVRQEYEFNIVAYGARAGECLIVSRSDEFWFTGVGRAKLADALDWIVTQGNEKFRSTEGKPPEFDVAVRISWDGRIRYAAYCPVIGIMWGTPEYVFAPLEGGPITLPWPHEVTARHLR